MSVAFLGAHENLSEGNEILYKAYKKIQLTFEGSVDTRM